MEESVLYDEERYTIVNGVVERGRGRGTDCLRLGVRNKSRYTYFEKR